jgi:SnoaL-like domain
MDALEAARHWADGWAHAWRTHDAELVGSLYEDGVSFRSQPFRELDDPAGYARWAFEDEAVAEVRFAEPIVTGADRAAVEYWANSTASDGRAATIAGVALLRFGTHGRVVDERDYWNAAHGRAEPYDGWGPVRP